MERLGLKDCQACQQIRTKSISVLPGENDLTGTMATVANSVSSFWWPNTVVHEDTPISIVDVTLLLQACMAEKKVTEQEIINRIKGMNIGQPIQRIKNKLKELQIIKPNVPNYYKIVNETCERNAPTKDGRKAQPKPKVQTKPAEVKPTTATTTGSAPAPGKVSVPKKVITGQETPNNKQMYYVGGAGILVVLAAAALLMGGGNK